MNTNFENSDQCRLNEPGLDLVEPKSSKINLTAGLPCADYFPLTPGIATIGNCPFESVRFPALHPVTNSAGGGKFLYSCAGTSAMVYPRTNLADLVVSALDIH